MPYAHLPNTLPGKKERAGCVSVLQPPLTNDVGEHRRLRGTDLLPTFGGNKQGRLPGSISSVHRARRGQAEWGGGVALVQTVFWGGHRGQKIRKKNLFAFFLGGGKTARRWANSWLMAGRVAGLWRKESPDKRIGRARILGVAGGRGDQTRRGVA